METYATNRPSDKNKVTSRCYIWYRCFRFHTALHMMQFANISHSQYVELFTLIRKGIDVGELHINVRATIGVYTVFQKK